MATIEPNFESICINPNDDLVLYKKEIVRSRIEKFLYAICSLDTDDLPTPLSRIEELYNCLVTGGDIPTFTPLSRAEKFVMAMLGAYDVELLPTPISRSETLMKKIATGDNNLDDVDNLQSRYEFLLAYIIKAGGFNGDSGNFYYKFTSLTSGLTTIYDTFNMPVKNAVLYGETKLLDNFNNEVDNPYCPKMINGHYLDMVTGELIASASSYVTENFIECPTESFILRGNNRYKRVVFYDENKTYISGIPDKPLSTNTDQAVSSIPSNAKYIKLSFSISTDSNTSYTPSTKIYLKDNNGNNLYLTHLESVKMPVLTTSNEDGTKTNILTCNEEVELRSIGDMRDELNLVTGELTQYVGAITIDDSHSWRLNTGMNGEQETYIVFQSNYVFSDYKYVASNLNIINDNFSLVGFGGNVNKAGEWLTIGSNGLLYVKISLSKLDTHDVNGFKKWLLQNPITIQYELAEPIVKTVDLSILNQDGKETELSTFDNITHVAVSSEGLVPTGEIITSIPIHFMNYSLDNSLTILSDTVEYPVKNAVLRGNTLVNLVGECRHNISTVENPKVWAQKRLFLTNVKTNTRYTMKVKMTEKVEGSYGPRVQVFFGDTSSGEINTTTSDTLIFTSPSVLSSQPHLRLITTGATAEQTDVDFEILLLEGEFPVGCDIPYFDHMTSVKMPVLTTTGKNLFNINKFTGMGIDEQGYYFPTRFIDNGEYTTLQLKPNTTYIVTGTYIYNGTASIIYRIKDNGSYRNLNTSFTTDATGVVDIKLGSNNYDVSNPSKAEKIMIVESTLKDIYEPHKSNILTCNEEVELRGIGDIKDELNLVTGELTQRIQERVFDGSENWIIGGTGTNYIKFRCESYTDMVKSSNAITCDRYAYNKENNALSNLSVTNSTTTGKICIVTSQTDLSIDNFKAKLNTDKPTIQYQLAEPIVKTVDLSTLDQDGKETELNTFDDITHVTVSSEGLVPTGEIDIARPIQFVDYSLDNSLTTLYNTIDYPVKNAILRGQTLVNISSLTGVTTLKPGNVIFIENTGMKMNTTYTIMFNCSNIPSTNFVEIRTMMDNTQITQVQQNVSVGYNKFTIKTNASKTTNRFRFKNDTTATTDFIFNELLILEGDYTNENIPYFEGMASVKMPVLTTVGKNLFDGEFKLSTFASGKAIIPNGIITSVSFPHTTTSKRRGISCIIQVKPNTNYTISIADKQANTVLIGTGYNNLDDISSQAKSVIHTGSVDNTSHTALSFTTPSNCNYMIIGCYIHYAYEQNGGTITFKEPPKIQLEENSVATTYEPHKSNILTCNEEVELRGIGDVKDELNLVTGELTQRIQERVFDGSENWIIGGTGDNHIMFRCESYTDMVKSSTVITCDRYAYNEVNNATSNLSVTNSTTTGKICIVTSQKDLSIDNFKAKLNTDKPIIRYQLAEPIIKTVDLSTLNQDGKETELSTFDDITHVITSSEELIPTGEIDIARPIQFVDYSLDNSLTTLYNTVEYPVKSAILRGQTLVNIIKKPTDENIGANKDWITQGSGIVTYSYDANKGVTLANCVDGSMVLDYLDLTLFKPNTEYTLFIDVTWNGVGSVPMLMDITTQAIHLNNGLNIVKFTSVPDLTIQYMCFRLGYTGTVEVGCEYTFNNIMVIEGDYTNTDIPYFEGMSSVKMPVLTTSNEDGTKSTTVSCNEEVELCSIGDMRDELNLVTGEYAKVIQEYTFTGNEIWKIGGGATGGYTYFNCNLSNFMPNYNYKTDVNIPIYCDKLPVITYNDFDNGVKNVGINLTYFFRLNFSDCDSNNGATVEDLKAYLKANPTTVQYPISKSVKAVDLSTLDQDGKETELSTFDDITHVITSSEELIPTGEITVATKDATDVIDISVMSLRMDDILNSQSTLEGTANAQSDDIDVTMLGATDIYEQLL